MTSVRGTRIRSSNPDPDSHLSALAAGREFAIASRWNHCKLQGPVLHCRKLCQLYGLLAFGRCRDSDPRRTLGTSTGCAPALGFKHLSASLQESTSSLPLLSWSLTTCSLPRHLFVKMARHGDRWRVRAQDFDGSVDCSVVQKSTKTVASDRAGVQCLAAWQKNSASSGPGHKMQHRVQGMSLRGVAWTFSV